jgi:flavin reductase (DIM6/NTAB) family NADH-FMN oxidoreductase RutF
MAVITIDPLSVSVPERQNYLQSAIAPRPVCFASTVDNEGNVNLSPFSFFNLFSIAPPVVVFSPSRRARNNTTKHTLENVLIVPEVVVNIVDYNMVQQVSLSSCDYPKGVNEFAKAGFTELSSVAVRPPRVAESLIQLECKVTNIVPLGDTGGAGNLVICEVLVMHIDDKILDERRQIDPFKLQHVARLGGDWYCRVSPSNLFKVAKPNVKIGIGIDALPLSIRGSRYLTGNHLGQLANVEEVPMIDPAFEDEQMRHMFQYYSVNPDELEIELHKYAAKLLDEGKVESAWQVLLALA